MGLEVVLASQQSGGSAKRFSIEDEGCASEARSRPGGWALPERSGAVGSAQLIIDPFGFLGVVGGQNKKEYSTKRQRGNGWRHRGKAGCVTCRPPRSLKGWALCLRSFLASAQSGELRTGTNVDLSARDAHLLHNGQHKKTGQYSNLKQYKWKKSNSDGRPTIADTSSLALVGQH
jgi:hypothetical protein